MILLDTNVLSELMRPLPDPNVVKWLDSRPASEIWINAVTVAEIQLGIGLLPEGRRKTSLASIAETMFREDFPEACLPFDLSAADHYAAIVVERQRAGRPITVEDAQIAAIARASGLTLVTRNTEDFSGIEGLTVVNPFLGFTTKDTKDTKNS